MGIQFWSILTTVFLLATGGSAACAGDETSRHASTGIKTAEASTLAPSIIEVAGAEALAGLSPDAQCLTRQLNLIPLLSRLKVLKRQVRALPVEVTLESLSVRQELTETRQELTEILDQTGLEADWVVSEILDERAHYDGRRELYQSQRDRRTAITNAMSFWTNGALWAVAEGLSIPTFRTPRFSIPSGTVGILAGLVPSAFSMRALREMSGRHHAAESNPNMLAKLFDYPVTRGVDYPDSVWVYLNSVSSEEFPGKSRRQGLIDQWLTDRDITSFKDPRSRQQLDLITASVTQRRGLTIGLLTDRIEMLQHLCSQVYKMKRLLLEIMRVVREPG